MSTVTINSESVQLALDNHFGKNNQEYFEKVTGIEIVKFIDIFFNLVRFDAIKFAEWLGNTPEHSFISTYDTIELKYGDEFLTFFKEELTSRNLNALAVIM